MRDEVPGKKATVLGGAATMAIGQFLRQGMAFLRNVIIARIISPDDFGIASTFVITIAFFEMASELGEDRLLVQSPKGDDPGLQKNAQLLIFLRGLALGTIYLLIAGPVARLFGVPQAAWAFRWLAIIPVFRGLMHLDVRRFQRQLRFWPWVSIDGGSQIIATLAAWPVAVWLGDYSVMLWLMVALFVTLTVGSHLVAERPYRWAFDRDYMRLAVEFGWPLMINGLIIYVIMQGTQAIVGTNYSMADLAAFALAFRLVSAPSNMTISVGGAVILPILGKLQENRARFDRYYDFICQVFSAASATMTTPLILLGSWAMGGLFGARYAHAGLYVGWLALAQGIVVLRGAPITASLALGDTKNVMFSNMARMIGVGVALVVALADGRLELVAASAALGEAAGMVTLLVRLRRRHGMSPAHVLRPLAIAAAFWTIAAALVVGGLDSLSWPLVAATALLMTIGPGAVMLIAFPHLRGQLRELASRLRAG